MMGGSSKPYEVGYGKPPKSGRFKPGQSGNKSGRPKATAVDDSFSRALRRKHRFLENGQECMLSAAEIIERQMIAKAAMGDFKAMMFVINRSDATGNVQQKKSRKKINLAPTADKLKSMSDDELTALYFETLKKDNGE